MASVGLAAHSEVSSSFGLGAKKKQPTTLIESVQAAHGAQHIAEMDAKPARSRLAPHLRKQAEWVAFAEWCGRTAAGATMLGMKFGQRNPHASETPPELMVQAATAFGDLLYEAYALGVKLGDPNTPD
jgi:hypothetical protein